MTTNPMKKVHGLRAFALAILVAALTWTATAFSEAVAFWDCYTPDSSSRDESTSIIRLARAGDSKNIARLLDAGIPADRRSWRGYTPLQIAADKGNLELATVLLDAGADPNLVSGPKDDKQCQATALFWPAFRGHLEMVRLLLDHGADPNAKNKNGGTAVEWADRHGHFEIVILLLEAMEGGGKTG